MSAAQLANRDPAAGARLIASLGSAPEREAAIREYARTLAANDLETWKRWRDTLPETERAAFDQWAFFEPEAAVEWLQKQGPGPARDDMVLTLVDVYAAKDPIVAAEWIQSIPDAGRRRNAAVAALASVGPSDLETVRLLLAAADRD